MDAAAIEEAAQKIPEMVPELKKLIRALKDSNLTREDFEEITSQLASNKDLIKPRENTMPPPLDLGSGEAKTPDEQLKPVNEKRDRAADRNLAALRSALTSAADDRNQQILRKVVQAQADPPVVISLRRPNTGGVNNRRPHQA